MTRFEHNGVRIGDLDAGQTELMHEFLRAALSPDGYAKVVGIVGAEDALAESSGRRLSADNYWLAFFGEPSAAEPWGWQFGGHHLAVNVTVVDGRSYLSPTLVAIQPASYEVDGVTVAPMAAEVQAGLALMNALDDDPAGGGAGATPQRTLGRRGQGRRDATVGRLARGRGGGRPSEPCCWTRSRCGSACCPAPAPRSAWPRSRPISPIPISPGTATSMPAGPSTTASRDRRSSSSSPRRAASGGEQRALPLDLSRSRPTNTERPRSTLADRRLLPAPSSFRRMLESSPVEPVGWRSRTVSRTKDPPSSTWAAAANPP